MVLLNWLMEGLVFTSGDFFLFQGAYTRVPQRPLICDKCDSHSGCFHAHGRYKRSLISFKKHQLKQIKVWMHRWLCLCCGRTMSNGPLDVIRYMPNCTLVIVAVLWAYLHGGKGIYNSIDPQLEEAAAPRTLARYLKRAKAVCRQTQQAIRKVLIDLKEPRPWDQCFAHGLSPPERLLNRHRDAAGTRILWQALAMLRIGALNLSTAPCLLMARARTLAQLRQCRFLL